MMITNLESLLYPSQTYSSFMQRHCDFFASLFGKELVAFGYEKLSNNGFYEGMSNLPKIAELFVETNAYQAMQTISDQIRSVEYGFIHADEFFDHIHYRHFRAQMDKELGIYSTFYAVENCLNYQNIFVWSFRAPLKSTSLTIWKNQILVCFMNNQKSIQYVLEQFKLLYRQRISKNVIPVKMLQQPSANEKTLNTSTPLDDSLIQSKCLKKEDLYLKNLTLSEKEASCIHFYLQGMSAKEIAAKVFASRRTIEDHIARIKEKLKVDSRSEVYAAMEKVNLWRSIL